MKQLLLIIAALFISATMNAGPVGKDEAQQKAAQFMTAKTGIQQSLQATQSGARRAGSTQQEPYYVFNLEGGGYVIVSGDDRTDDILGYSLTGTFDAKSIPNNMRAFLQEYADGIQYLIDNNVQVVKDNRAARRAPEKTAIEPMLKTTWDQTAPYNAMCPEANGYRTFTGCLATAMAQIMNYHQWPAATSSTIPAYQTETYQIHMEAIPAGEPIAWDLMQNAYNESYQGTAAEDAVAKLMLLCGTSVEMNYGLDADGGSSSSIVDAEKALVNYFDYEEQTVRIINRYSYSYNDWQDLIYQELQAQRPVLYSGQSSGGGHAFVCDGYDTDDFFHINWGWSGQSDTYFRLKEVNPNDQGAGGSSSADGYSKSQQVIIGIQKNDGEKVDMRRLTTLNFSTAANKSYTRTSKEGNITVTFNVERYNWTGETATFNAGFRIYNSNNEAVGNDISDPKMDKQTYGMNYGWKGNINLSFGANLEDGDYRILPVSCVTGFKKPDVYGEENYVAFHVDGNQFTITYTSEDPVLELISSNVTGVKEAGAPLTITLLVGNKGGAIHDDVYIDIYYRETNATANTKENIGYFPVSFLELAKNESATIETSYIPKTAGVYTLELVDKNHKKLGPNVEFTITRSTAPLLSLEEMEIVNLQTDEGQSYVEENTATIKLKIKNEGSKIYRGQLIGRYQAFCPDENKWYYLASSDFTENLDIKAGTTSDVTITMSDQDPLYAKFFTLQRIEFTYTQYETQEVALGETPNIEFRTVKIRIVDETVENPGEDGGNTFTGNKLTLNFDIQNNGYGDYNNYIGASIQKYNKTWYWNQQLNAYQTVSIPQGESKTVQFSIEINDIDQYEKFRILLFKPNNGQWINIYVSEEYTHAEDSGIEEVMFSGNGKPNKVHNLQGRQVGMSTDFNTLQPGIYIVGGKKLMKR